MPPRTWAMVGRLAAAVAALGGRGGAGLPMGVGAGALPAPAGRAPSGDAAAGVAGWTGEGRAPPVARSAPAGPPPVEAALARWGAERAGGAGGARAASGGGSVDREDELEAAVRPADRVGTVCHSPAASPEGGGIEGGRAGGRGGGCGRGRRWAGKKKEKYGESWERAARAAGQVPLPSPLPSGTPLSPPSPLLHMLLPLAALLLAASAAAPARAGTTTVDLYRNNAVLDNLGGKERPAKNVAVSFGGGGVWRRRAGAPRAACPAPQPTSAPVGQCPGAEAWADYVLLGPVGLELSPGRGVAAPGAGPSHRRTPPMRDSPLRRRGPAAPAHPPSPSRRGGERVGGKHRPPPRPRPPHHTLTPLLLRPSPPPRPPFISTTANSRWARRPSRSLPALTPGRPTLGSRARSAWPRRARRTTGSAPGTRLPTTCVRGGGRSASEGSGETADLPLVASPYQIPFLLSLSPSSSLSSSAPNRFTWRTGRGG